MNTLPLQTRSFVPPRFAGGALTALKWLALVLMVVDHVEAFVLQREFDSQLGRLVFPIFACIIGYNLALPLVDRRKVFMRLFVFGWLALPFHATLLGSPLPMNVLFTFAAAVAVVHAIEAGRGDLALTVFMLGGALVEYWWPGIGLVVAVWMMYSGGPRAGLVAAGWCVAALCVLQSSVVPLLGVALVYLVREWEPGLPRMKWAFYVFYPTHLAAFWWVLR